MLGFENTVVNNYKALLESWMKLNKKGAKASYLYTFDTIVRDHNGMPVGRIVVQGDVTQILPVGEKLK